MYTLFALVLTAAVVVIARPPGPPMTTAVSDDDSSQVVNEAPARNYLGEYVLPRYLWPHYVAYEDARAPEPNLPATDWLSKEIERLSLMQDRAAAAFIRDEPREMAREHFMKRLLGTSSQMTNPAQAYLINHPPLESWNQLSEAELGQHQESKPSITPNPAPLPNNSKKNDFAMTPLDGRYFEDVEKESAPGNVMLEGMHEGGGPANMIQLEPPRQIRQNPNRNKNLVADDLDKLIVGLDRNALYATESPRYIRVDSDVVAFDGSTSFYGVAVVSAIGAAVVMAIIGFGIGWYTLSKRAKAAADVDYPAYGVTGPSIDISGDRKLAHSAHMYHYQHQKQQIIAMERNALEQRNGSISDPESEEENEEGDYTVYECPGFATTGDMEVKNPLFNEDPTPATPGKCDIVKPQPKD